MTTRPRNNVGRRPSPRRGIGLLEVIVCTALVALMIVPLAAVIQASTRSIARANGSPSTEAELRRALWWVSNTIRDGQLVSVRSNRLQVQTRQGDVATFRVSRGTLWMEDGEGAMAMVESVRSVRFTEQTQAASPQTRTGLTIEIRARDSRTGDPVTVRSTLSIPPQA